MLDLDKLKADLKANGQTADLLKELCLTAGLVTCEGPPPFGGVFIRQMKFPDVGSYNGHAHSFDHISHIISGKFLIKYYKVGDDGEKARDAGPIREEIFEAPAVVCIAKKTFHDIICLEGPGRIDCTFAMRDFKTGKPVDYFNGDMRPYE